MSHNALEEPEQVDDRLKREGRLRGFILWYKTHKKLTIPLSVTVFIVVIGGLLFVIPSLRYSVLSHFVSKSYSVRVIDSKTNDFLVGADVSLGDQKVKTNEDGQARLEKIPVGNHTITVSKSLYDTQRMNIIVPIFTTVTSEVGLKANGRQVVVKVTDKITNAAIEGAKVVTDDFSSQTNKEGNVTVVVPVGSEQITAQVEKDGYISSATTITQQSKAAASLVKTGRIYFLSKQSGTVDVISSNLDGSSRQTVLKGTGNEDGYTTSLLASRDWQYLMLYAKRDTKQAALYLIDTQDTSSILYRITNGATSVASVGWSGHRFVYKEHQPSQQGGYSDEENWRLNSVNAADRRIVTLERVEKVPTPNHGDAYQEIGTPYILDGDTIVYASIWRTQNYHVRPEGKESGVISVQADGSNRRFIKSYPSQEISYVETKLYKPQEIHYRVFNMNGERRENIMTINKKIETVPPEQQKFDESYPTFLISPDGKRALWAEPRDGKNTLFVGDNNSGNPQQLTTLSEYTVYGWFTDGYLLLQKNDSELFITTTDVLKSGNQPLKITDYHKPARSLNGYGYGYGGQ